MKRFLPFFLVAAVTVWAGSAFGAGWVTVGLPLDNDNLTDAELVGQDIPYCTDVAEYDEATQSWVQHPVGTPIQVFPTSVTMALMAYVSQDSVWTLTGGVIDSTAYSFSLVNGWNFVTVPLNKLSLTDAELLGQDVPNCTDVAQWDASSQAWVQHPVGTPIQVFSTRVGYPYMVFCSAAGTWGGGTVAAKAAGKTEEQLRVPRSVKLIPMEKR